MRLILAAALVVVPAVSALAAAPSDGCGYPNRTPIVHDTGIQTMFVNTCGERYEAGYRLEGNTLRFPRGGAHTLPEATPAQAEAVLRDAYGLVGERDALVRTRWPE